MFDPGSGTGFQPVSENTTGKMPVPHKAAEPACSIYSFAVPDFSSAGFFALATAARRDAACPGLSSTATVNSAGLDMTLPWARLAAVAIALRSSRTGVKSTAAATAICMLISCMFVSLV